MAGHSPFLYGAATSAHQVEGNNVHNDWWAWEETLASSARSGVAVDHYRRFREDLALARRLGHTAHRISLEWSRIELSPGVWNQAAVEHYREVLREMKRLGLSSFVTLHHFTNPLWFAQKGGWLSPEAPEQFTRYVTFVTQQLGDLVDVWITFNEPMVYALKSYWAGQWPPHHRHQIFEVGRVLRQMVHAHRQAYRAIHQRLPRARVGIAQHMTACQCQGLRQSIRGYTHSIFNHWFLKKVRSQQDFIGVNYYAPCKSFDASKGTHSDMGWPIYSVGLRQVLQEAARYGVPLYVMENGVADAKDVLRADFIRDHLRAVEEAQREGIDVQGYLYWSLLDNFEWADGWGPKFGLVAVDRATQERKVRHSARVYQAIIEQDRQPIH